MKKIQTWALAMITIITAGFTLTSCDEDNMQASDLDGGWRGDYGMYYVDRQGKEWDASYSIIEFYQEGYTSHGTGKQYDYYKYGPIEWEFYRFKWHINNGIIYIDYPYPYEDLNTTIYDYRMTARTFDGYFGNSNSYFTLDKYRDWNWSSYNGDYQYYNRSSYYDYYSKTRAAENDSVSAQAKPHENANIIVRHGNRNNEK